MQYPRVKAVFLSWALLPWDVKLKDTVYGYIQDAGGPIVSTQGEVSSIKKPRCLFLELGF